MNKKKVTLLVLSAALVLLLAGAGVLYARLGDQWAPDSLLVQTPATHETQAADSATASTPAADTTAPAHETQALQQAPDFTVYDSDGNAVKLSDFFGKPIVLNFWASWCGPCQSEMPDFQEKYEQFGEDIHFLMINMTSGRETADSAKAFIEDKGYTFPVFYDTQGSAAYSYSVYYLPTTYFIDARGNAVAMATRALSAELLQQGIDMIAAEGAKD